MTHPGPCCPPCLPPPCPQLLGGGFSGALPLAWANATEVEVISLRGNQLSGPAFPPAWVAPGALARLRYLVLAGNRLTGSLPPTLAWPNVATM